MGVNSKRTQERVATYSHYGGWELLVSASRPRQDAVQNCKCQNLRHFHLEGSVRIAAGAQNAASQIKRPAAIVCSMIFACIRPSSADGPSITQVALAASLRMSAVRDASSQGMRIWDEVDNNASSRWATRRYYDTKPSGSTRRG